ncbi:hypothetical protein CPB85DRAFT_1429191 [Mucidula mucida]|nr:hypothetical protein CPB85DRAFT_1429191 [Mucidula mucida]
MESTEELQQNELLVLESIYAEDYKLIPPPKAWKGATRTPEFNIVVRHPDRANICFDLNVKFPKTYPRVAYPNFTITKPIHGLDNDQVTKLNHAIQEQVQKHRGSEMVFQIVQHCQDWLSINIVPPVEVTGSLALQMKQRAVDEERERQLRADQEAAEEAERQARLAEEFDNQIKADAQKQQLAKEMQVRARQRAGSEATEVPLSGDIPTETFERDIEMDGVRFSTVRFFHPRDACLGTIYSADPVCDDVNVTLPLELHVVAFDSPYYKSSQGRKKLKQLEEEISRLITVRHDNVLRVLAVKLHTPHSSAPPQLIVLSEQTPSLTLRLHAIHSRDLVHRGITLRCIGLTNRSSAGKLVKIGKVAYYTQLQDMHRSNAFSKSYVHDDPPIRESWLSKDVKNESLLLYTKLRDIHSTGIVFLQMVLGIDVVDRYPDPLAPLSSDFQRLAMEMLIPKKNQASCMAILHTIADTSFQLHPPNVNRSPAITFQEPKTPLHGTIAGSPEADYFRVPGPRHTSRWKEDWEELELLGRGAFGSVVKARNKIDSRVYAVKKVRLKAVQSDAKIFREVNALSRLNHRFIVRYYTTWVETSEPTSAAASDEENSSESGYETENGMTSVPSRSRFHSREMSSPIIFNMDDLDEVTTGMSGGGSFPSIHFTHSGDGTEEEDDTDSDGDGQFGDLFRKETSLHTPTPVPEVQRTLYIQMEFVERQTLKERVDEGLSENEAWRLFQQIVDALVHMSTLGILHRDIKLTNIFIGNHLVCLISELVLTYLEDAKGDCKVGDFGLATSSLAAVDPSDVSPRVVLQEADMTLEVGTRLYIAPEVQSRRRRPTNHTKADMYSLGVGNCFASIGDINIHVDRFLRDELFLLHWGRAHQCHRGLRKPDVIFPESWDLLRINQREIITSLLQHDPDDRPTALELSQSTLLPSRLEDEYFKGALRMMGSPSFIVKQPARPSLNILYYTDAEPPEHASLNGLVQEHLMAIFRLHGAIDVEPPLLMAVTVAEDDREQATFIDRHGDVVTLPSSLLRPFARVAARSGTTRIKRYHISNAYRVIGPGHPKPHKAAVFDIITPDLTAGPTAAGAEILAVVNNCLNTFPHLGDRYEIFMSHSFIIETILSRLPAAQQTAVIDVMNQSKSSMPQKRASLLKKGLLRSTVDELEVLNDTYEDLEHLMLRLDKLSSPLLTIVKPVIDEMKSAVKLASLAGASRPVKFYPLMLGSHLKDFKDGVLIEVARRSHRIDLLAVGGRYDNLIAKYTLPGTKVESVYALGLQISIDKITAAVAVYQSSLMSSLKELRSFGYWSPRRCDVYVICYHPGYLQERLELAAYLWRHNISTDVMYESAITNVLDHTTLVELCKREGILFTVNPRPKRDQVTGVKVTSVFGGDEDVMIPKQELVAHLHDAITAQKRADSATSGATTFFEGKTVLSAKESPILDLQAVLPADLGKKGLKRNKTIIQDKAHDLGVKIHKSLSNNMPMLVVDIPPASLALLAKSSTWITDDDAWKSISGTFINHIYAQQVRDAVAKRKADGYPFILLYATREERATLLQLL